MVSGLVRAAGRRRGLHMNSSYWTRRSGIHARLRARVTQVPTGASQRWGLPRGRVASERESHVTFDSIDGRGAALYTPAMNLDADIFAELRRCWGYDSFRPLQERIVRSLLGRHDVCVVMPTGGGKSLCYQLPAAMMGAQTAIVVSPLIALMQDQVAQLEQMGIPAAMLNSSLAAARQNEIVRRASEGKYRLLYLSPERLAREDSLAWLARVPISFFAIDEAHCISEWGHEFRPDYRLLSRLRTHFPGCPIAAFTASATQRVRHDIIEQLHLREPHKFIASFHRPNLRYIVKPCDGASQRELLLSALREHAGSNVIIYAPTIKRVEETVEILRRRKDSRHPLSRADGCRFAQNESGALDVRRCPRAGGHHRFRPGDQQGRRARRDSPFAAQVGGTVLSGGRAGRARRPAVGLPSAVAEARCRSAGAFHRTD